MTTDERATVWLITGPTGAGKTTYAKRLAAEAGVLSFSIDEWMRTLFWMDAPEGPSLPWAAERVARCNLMIQSLALQACALGEAKLGRGAVLDLGFSKRSERERFYAWAAEHDLCAVLVHLDLPAETRWARVAARNAAPGSTSIGVSREIFDWMERYFEPPDEPELAAHRGRRLGDRDLGRRFFA